MIISIKDKEEKLKPIKDINQDTLLNALDILQVEQDKELLESYSQSVKPIQKEMDTFREIMETPAIKQVLKDINTISLKYQESFSIFFPQIEEINNIILQYSSLLSDTKTLQMTFDYTYFQSSTFLNWLNSVQSNIQHQYDNVVLSVVMNFLYKCKWFPYAAWTTNKSNCYNIFNIIFSPNMIDKEKALDQIIIPSYSNDKIQETKKAWNNSTLNNVTKQIFEQSLDAHIRGEYALCINSLVLNWEQMIEIKTNNTHEYDRKRTNSRFTKENFAKLTTANNYPEIFIDFFENIIYSDCNCVQEIKEDVPNRHGIAHGWYKNYPTEKASLNAILLTDFLINIQPINN